MAERLKFLSLDHFRHFAVKCVCNIAGVSMFMSLCFVLVVKMKFNWWSKKKNTQLKEHSFGTTQRFAVSS